MRSLPTSVCSRRAASSRASGEGRCTKSCRWSAIEGSACLSDALLSLPGFGEGRGGVLSLVRGPDAPPDLASLGHPPPKPGREKASLSCSLIERKIERQDVDVGLPYHADQRA